MSFPRPLVWSLTALALVACTSKDGTGDTDDTQDTDTQSNDDVDTDPVDTDPVVDTDPIDTDPVDTDIADTDVEDSAIDTGGLGVVDTTIRVIRQRTGGFRTADLLHIDGVTVVEVRSSITGPRGFTVQEAGSDYAALWVDVPAPGLLPQEGASVGVIGAYRELGAGPVGPGTQTQLQVGPSFANTEWIQLGTSTRPSPVVMTPAAFNANPEPYESMRVLLDDSPLLVVSDGPRGDDSFDLTVSGTAEVVTVLPLFYNMHSSAPGGLPNLAVDDTFNAIGGTIWFDANGYALAPTALGDGLAYTAYVPPIGGDTDTGTGGGPGGPIDTDFNDTGLFDSGVDSDTDPPAPTIANVQNLHAGVYGVGSIASPLYLNFESGVVTATRYRSSPVATNAVTVQFPQYPDHAGLYLLMFDTSTLPQPGDLINFTGNYVEDPTGASIPNASLSILRIAATDPSASWSNVGSASRPTPVDLTPDDLMFASTAEPYESMLVRLTDPDGFAVTSTRNSLGDFRIRVTTGGVEVTVTDNFFDLTQAYGVTTTDTLTSLTGVIFWEGSSYKIAPTTLADADGYIDAAP